MGRRGTTDSRLPGSISCVLFRLRFDLRRARVTLLHFPYLKLAVPVEQGLVQQIAYYSSARWHRVNKITAHQTGLSLIPAPHRAWTSHSLEGVEKTAACF